jgi:hypothetical protein
MNSNTKNTQIQTIFHYLQNNISTASMVSQATGIPQKNFTRYKKDLEKKGLIREIERQNCKVTGCKAWYLTTKPDFVNSNKNLDTIRKEERDSESVRGYNYTNYI